MRRILTTSLCLGLALFTCALILQAKDSKADSGAALMQTFRAIEQSWLDAEKASDPAAFEKLAADESDPQ